MFYDALVSFAERQIVIMNKDSNIALIKVIAIFLVILDHTSSWFNFFGGHIKYYCLFQSISKCAVPVFFMVTGALLINKKEESLSVYAKKRFRKIIIPFIIWSLIWQLYQYYVPLQDWQRTLSDVNLSNPFYFLKGHTAAHLWFMYVLIFIYILIPIIQVIIHNSRKEIKIYFMILLVVFSLKNFYESICGPTEWPGINTEYIMYSVLGYFIYNNYQKICLFQCRKLKFIIMCILFGLNNLTNTYFLLSAYNNNIKISMTVCMGANCPLVIINAILIFWFLLSIMIPPVAKESILSLSANTMGVFYIHFMVLFVLTKANIHTFNFFDTPTPTRIILTSLVCFFICNIIIYIIKKIPILNKALT